MRILLVGLMGSGKSTVGRRLSARTGWPYLDNDQLVAEVSGRPAPALIADEGEDELHAIEVAGLRAGPDQAHARDHRAGRAGS